MKRVLLFFATNLLVIITLSLLLNLLGIQPYLSRSGINYGSLFLFCLVWGMGGALISLGISRMMAKWAMGVEVVDARGPYADLVEMVHELARKAKLPAMPEVGVYQSPEANAFATGPTKSRALVAVSTGLLKKMDRDEVEGVLGHEIAHIANGDMVTMTLIQGVINAFVMFFARIIAWAVTQRMRGEGRYMFTWILTLVLEIGLGILGYMVVAWFSRYREYRADSGGAALSGRTKMIAALRRLEKLYAPTVKETERAESLATLKISGKASGWLALMSTHPPLEQRIARLSGAGR